MMWDIFFGALVVFGIFAALKYIHRERHCRHNCNECRHPCHTRT